MQVEVKIPVTHLWYVVAALFSEDHPVVYEGRSKFEEELRSFDSEIALEADIEDRRLAGEQFFTYSIYYPLAKGLVHKRRIELIPEKNGGSRFRFCKEGWGLIHLQLNFKEKDMVCAVTVNSEKRALGWLDTYPHLGHPSLWDWKIVEKHARCVIRTLKKPNKKNGDNDCAGFVS